MKSNALTLSAASCLLLCTVAVQAETRLLQEQHKQLYRAGGELNLSEVLGLDEIEAGTLRQVSITYNMAFSKLGVEWLFDGEVIGRTELPKGLGKTVRQTYDRPLPGRVAIRLTGKSGQIQTLATEASVEVSAAAASRESGTGAAVMVDDGVAVSFDPPIIAPPVGPPPVIGPPAGEPPTIQPPDIGPPTFDPPIAMLAEPVFPEFAIPVQPQPPGPHVPSEGVDLHAYFTDATYDQKTKKLTFTFEMANWGDTDCHDVFAYTVKPGIYIHQTMRTEMFEDRRHAEQYLKWLTAPPPEQASNPISLAAGESRRHTVNYDMSDPVVWGQRGVMVGVWNTGAVPVPPRGTYDDSAWLPIRPEGFDYRAVMVGNKGDFEQKRTGGILRVRLAEFRNMGASSYQLIHTTVRHAFYSERIDPERLLANPDAYEEHRIAIGEPFRNYYTFDNHDELKAMGAGDYLGLDKVFPYYNYVRDEDWERTKTVRVWIEKVELDRWIKYPHLTPVAYQR